jgi:hypothetical protein
VFVENMRRDPPNVPALLGLLNEHEVRFVVTGSVAAMLYGVALEPGDLDITPARDYANLDRLACVLELIEARQYADEPFGNGRPIRTASSAGFNESPRSRTWPPEKTGRRPLIAQRHPTICWSPSTVASTSCPRSAAPTRS